MTSHEAPVHYIDVLNESTAKFSDVVGNNDDIIDAYLEEVERLEQEGTLNSDIPEDEELRREWYRRAAKAEGKRNGDRIKKAHFKSEGLQGALDLGDDYDLTVTVCNKETLNEFYGVKEYTTGRSVNLGALNSVDLLLMRKGLEITYKKVVKRWQKLDSMYIASSQVLARFTNYHDYRASQS